MMNKNILLMIFALGCGIEENSDDEKENQLSDNDNDSYFSDEDCDDQNPVINPSATDLYGDGIDQNCDGIDGTDFDGDGAASEPSGGQDCDDQDADLNPHDEDEDGFSTCDNDCDDQDPELFPQMIDSVEYCGLPKVTWNPQELDFAAGQLECAYEQNVTFTNEGDAPLFMESVETTSSGFSADMLEDLIILPGESADVTVTFSPELESAYSGLLVVNNSDLDDPVVNVPIEGNGHNLAFVSHRGITQNSAIDIIFAVDRSCSMDDDIEGFNENFGLFFEPLLESDIDYQVSATVEDSGCINGPDLFVNNQFSAAQAQTSIATMINLGGTYGSNTEMAFSLFEATLDEAANPLGCNHGLIREEADLLLIGLSDEADQSPLDWLSYVELFEDVYKPGPETVIIGGIGGDHPAGCTTAQGSLTDPYSGIYEASLETGGPFVSICSTDYLPGLADFIINDIDGLNTSVQLTSTPDVDSISVTVDNQPVSFTYNESSNRVYIDVDPGLEYEVTYTHIDLLSDKDEDGFTTCDGDCNDLLPNTYPGSTLDSEPFECMLDADGDGYAQIDPSRPYLSGTDCDDTSSNVYPNAPEICANGIDENCDGNDPISCSSIEPTIDISDTSYPMCTWIDISAAADQPISNVIWELSQAPETSTVSQIETTDTQNSRMYLDSVGEYELTLLASDASYWSDPQIHTFTVEEQSLQIVPVQIQSNLVELDGGNVECYESGYSYICDTCTATVNTEDLVNLSHPEQEPFVTTWSSQNSAITILSDDVYPDISINHTAEEPGMCSTETFELELRVDYCRGSETETIPVDVVCCGTAQ